MKARYRILHTSTYRYDQPATASLNEARLTPLGTRWQNPLENVLRVDNLSWQFRYVDYWGTQVRVFEAERPHSELVVSASSLVEVEPALRPVPDRDLGWDDVRSPAVTNEFGEFLTQSASTEPAQDLVKLAESLVVDPSPAETALAISNCVHEAMSYVPGSTGVQTSAAEAWSARSGVCQDYAHLVVGALRHVGLPARYVSGYLHPNASAALGEPVVGESHAWVEWWLGQWIAHDPTNASMVSDRHVVVGMGRDYRDVPPIKGIVAGSPVTTALDVKVEITRLA
ncbi:MAG: transglutaminase family protein [Actinomycetota bacterium]|nr:transglutaminase family protein [Actinomycetota bacterium]